MSQASYAITACYRGSFDQAVSAITQALSAEGFGILTQVDVKQTLKKKLDVEFPRYMIFGVCNPASAYRALQAEAEIGLLLPCNVIVRQNDTQVCITLMKPTAALALSENKVVAKIAAEVEKKLVRALENTVS